MFSVKATAKEAGPKAAPAAGSGKGVSMQRQLTVGKENDPLEHEADAVANKVMRMPEQNFVQRKCAACEGEEKLQRKPLSETVTPFIQAKSDNTPIVNNQTAQSIAYSKGSGSAMDSHTNSFMSSRFGKDFSDVKIHTGGEAVQLSRDVNAKAFTTGKDIYFNEGQYQPNTDRGKNLLAHELTHTIQQNHFNVIQRACSAEDQVKYDEVAANIKTLPYYLNTPKHPKAIFTPSQAKQKADDIIAKAKGRDNCLYYIQFLQMLFSTAEEAPGEIGDTFRKIMTDSADAETERLKKEPDADRNFEENATRDIKRTGRTIRNAKNNKIYYVDSSDINNIYVFIQVKLNGNENDTRKVKQMEDGIEKAASISGYTVNLEFTEKSGADVFETDVDPTQWPTAGNWVMGVDALAHELHHLLNLPDRYNYIESHSENKKMFIANRIHWFTEEFNRTEDINKSNSLMGKGNLIMAEDVCKVINPNDAVAEADCITKRKALDYPAYAIKSAAFGKVQRLFEVIAGFIPATLLNPRADEHTIPLARETILKTAALEFGQEVSADFLYEGLSGIKTLIASALIQMESRTDPRCIGQNIEINKSPVAFIICPSFMGLSKNDQLHEIIRLGYRMYQEFPVVMVNAKMVSRGSDPAVGKQWADFIIKAADRI